MLTVLTTRPYRGTNLKFYVEYKKVSSTAKQDEIRSQNEYFTDLKTIIYNFLKIVRYYSINWVIQTTTSTAEISI